MFLLVDSLLLPMRYRFLISRFSLGKVFLRTICPTSYYFWSVIGFVVALGCPSDPVNVFCLLGDFVSAFAMLFASVSSVICSSAPS